MDEPDQTVSRAAFLGGLLAFAVFATASVIGVGHARSLRGAANPQFWIIVVISAVSLVVIVRALARTTARTENGELARKAGVVLAAIWTAAFVWETVAIGSGAFRGPLALIAGI